MSCWTHTAWNLSQVERAYIDGEEEGFAAIHTRRGTGEIVGATLVAAHAGEMISELTLAVTSKLPMAVLAETVHCFPTQAEVFQRIALEYLKATKQTSQHWICQCHPVGMGRGEGASRPMEWSSQA